MQMQVLALALALVLGARVYAKCLCMHVCVRALKVSYVEGLESVNMRVD